jgi:hypothetical protein
MIDSCTMTEAARQHMLSQGWKIVYTDTGGSCRSQARQCQKKAQQLKAQGKQVLIEHEADGKTVRIWVK